MLSASHSIAWKMVYLKQLLLMSASTILRTTILLWDSKTVWIAKQSIKKLPNQAILSLMIIMRTPTRFQPRTRPSNQ